MNFIHEFYVEIFVVWLFSRISKYENKSKTRFYVLLVRLETKKIITYTLYRNENKWKIRYYYEKTICCNYITFKFDFLYFVYFQLNVSRSIIIIFYTKNNFFLLLNFHENEVMMRYSRFKIKNDQEIWI